MRFLRTKLLKLRRQIVLAAYNKYFGRFVYSFEKTDEKIARLTETERNEYYRSITEWVTSNAYKIEYEGEVGETYEELASKASNEDVMTAYRLALLKTKNRDLRYKDKVKIFNAQQVLRNTRNNIK